MLRKLVGVSVVVVAVTTISLVVLGSYRSQDRGGPPPGGGPGPGFGPGPGGPPGDFGPGTFLAPRVIEEADANKDGRLSPEEAGRAAEKFVRDADTGKKGSVDAVALGKAVNRRMGPPPGDGPDDMPDDFGPGTFLAQAIVEAADANKDGRLSPEEAASAAAKFVREADTGKKGSLDGDALAAAMNRRMGPPPGFGPGGPGGPMGQERKLVEKFDKDGDGRLGVQERLAARESLKAE